MLVSVPVQAQTAIPSASGSLLQMLIGLVITLALLFGALLILKRLQGNRGNQPGAMRIISTTAVGPRERVVLIAVGKQALVVGVAPGRVNALHTLPLEDIPETPAPSRASIPGNDFARRLKQILERRGEK